MTWEEIQSNWHTVKDQAKQAWPRLTEAELEVTGGSRETLIDKVREAQSLSHEDAEREVDAWQQGLN